MIKTSHNESIALTLRALRKERRLSLNRLSALCGLSSDYLWRIEKGKATNIGIESLEKIMRALNTEFSINIEERRAS